MNWSDDPKGQRMVPFDFVEMHDQISKVHSAQPDLCICFLETSVHSMVFVHDGSVCVGLDGMNHPSLRSLSKGAALVAKKLGFPETHITYPQLWDQMDDWSCGWHVLHFLEFLLLGTNNMHDLRAYLFCCLAQPTIFYLVDPSCTLSPIKYLAKHVYTHAISLMSLFFILYSLFFILYSLFFILYTMSLMGHLLLKVAH